jgi:hypothetical protein
MQIKLRSDPSISREIEISSSKSLYHLAEAIVEAFGFDFDHAFGFYSGRSERDLLSSHPRYELVADIGEESDAGSVKRTKIADAFAEVGSRMTFLFDYGDEWLFEVSTIGVGEQKPKTRYPRILRSVGRAPEQYPEEEDLAE